MKDCFEPNSNQHWRLRTSDPAAHTEQCCDVGAASKGHESFPDGEPRGSRLPDDQEWCHKTMWMGAAVYCTIMHAC